MGAQGIRLPGRAFRDRYLTLLQAAGIKPDQARWYVLRVEQYLKAHPDLALADHGPEHLDVGGGSVDPHVTPGEACRYRSSGKAYRGRG